MGQKMNAPLRAAAYVRMSTDPQVDSPARQRAEIIRLAERENCQIVEWYEDHGKSGTESTKRKAFQRLMADAGAKKFAAILMYEQSRFSREDVFDVVAHWRVLKEANVTLITCQRGRMNFDDLGGFISAVVDAHSARDESIKFAQRSVSGRRTKSQRGERNSGSRVFGYDREFSENGAVVARIHFRKAFSKPRGWKLRLVPSEDTEAVDAVRFMFRAYRDGQTMTAIAREINRRGITSINGKQFTETNLVRILSNPVYIGTLRAGMRGVGKFARINADGPIQVENVHEPIIDSGLFFEVQRHLDIRKVNRQKGPAGRHLLSGIARCATCGAPLHGHSSVRKGRSKTKRMYHCQSRRRRALSLEELAEDHCNITADWLEGFVIQKVSEQLASPNMAKRLRTAIASYCAEKASDVTVEEGKLTSVLQQITKAETNLALADTKEDFNAIKSRLAVLRKQRDELKAKIVARKAKVSLSPQATAALNCMQEAIATIGKADRPKLRMALMTIIRRVVVGRIRKAGIAPQISKKRSGPVRNLRFDRIAIRIEYEPGVFDCDVAEYEVDHFATHPHWRAIIDFVKNGAGLVTTREVATSIGLNTASALQMLKRATVAGFVKWHGNQRGGWVSADTPVEQLPQPRIVTEVVEYLAQANRPLETREVATHFGLGKTTALMRLRMAQKAGLVKRFKYGPSVYAWTLRDAELIPITSLRSQARNRRMAVWLAFIACQNRIVTALAFAQHFDIHRSTAMFRLAAMEEAGLVVKVGGRTLGWMPTPVSQSNSSRRSL